MQDKQYMPDLHYAHVVALFFSFLTCVLPVEDPCCPAVGQKETCQPVTNGRDPRAILNILEASMHCVGHVGASGRLVAQGPFPGSKPAKPVALPPQAVQARLGCSKEKCHLPSDGSPGASLFNGNL